MERLIAVLAASPLFRSVDLEVLQPELAQTSELALEVGVVLLEPARANEDIYIVLAGRLIASVESSSSNPLAVIHPGECIGEISVIDDHPPSAYVVADTAVRLLKIPRLLFWRMQEKQHALSFNLLRILAERFRGRNASLLHTLQLHRQFRNQVETDVLTGLKNRAWMEEMFPQQLELSERLEQSIALAMIDIDHFKKVNDAHGHRVGDEALRAVGAVIRTQCRAGDLAARYGGEELAVLMPATEAAQAVNIGERLRQAVADTPIPLESGEVLRITISVGIASGLPGVSLDALFKQADQALYRAKSEGRNRVGS